MMPAVEVSNQPLGKVLENIRKQVPSFHFAVFRSPSVSPDYPTLPVMSLEGVTIDQFLDLIKFQYPDIKIVEISGEKQPLYSIRIDDTASLGRKEAAIKLEYAKADLASKKVDLQRKQQLVKANAASQSEVEQAELAVQLAQSQMSMAMLESERSGLSAKNPGADAGVVASPPVVKVFRLNEVIANFKSETDPKKATDDILSLVQAAMDASGGDPKDQPTLKLHQPTQTLIFKGSPEKLAVLEQVLEALRPRESDETAKLKSKVEKLEQQLVARETDRAQFTDQLNGQLNKYELENRVLMEKLLETQSEVGRLQGQLKATTQPSK
jgi:hypothetical protein